MPNSLAQALPRARALRRRAYAWRRELPVAKQVALALGMAALTGACAQVRVPLPFSPVPLTGQTFAVLLAGVLLGGGFGALSQIIYVALGAAGVPWFTGFGAGLGWLAGPTAGYLFGFVAAAALIGWVSDASVRWRALVPQMALMAGGSALILLCGAAHLAIVLGLGWPQAMLVGVVPFLAGDALKALAAALAAAALLPKSD